MLSQASGRRLFTSVWWNNTRWADEAVSRMGGEEKVSEWEEAGLKVSDQSFKGPSSFLQSDQKLPNNTRQLALPIPSLTVTLITLLHTDNH